MTHRILDGLAASLQVARAELRRTLRDPHVVAYLLAPIAIYPMLIWGSLQLSLYEAGRTERESLRVEVEGPPDLVAAFSETPFEAGTGGLAALQEGTSDALVETTVGPAGGWRVQVHHTSTRARSRRALGEVQARLTDLREERFEALAAEAGVDRDALRPLVMREEWVSAASDLIRSIVGVLIGYIGCFALLIASIYPAIDMIVAEREKGTLETLLLAAVPRWTLLAGKLLACATLALLASVGNMLSLGLTMVHAGSLLSQIDGVDDLGLSSLVTFEPLTVAMALPALGATAMLAASAAILAVVPARSFKEGELTATSVVMVAFVPGVVAVVALVAGEAGGVVLLPLANLIVVLQRALAGDLSWALALGAAVENLLVAGVLAAAAAALLGREDMLIGGRLPRWMARILRRDM